MAIRSRKVDLGFVFHFLDNSFDDLQSEKKGTGIPGIGRENILDKYFPLPPLVEQHRIVAKLEQLMQHCDALEQRIRESRRLAEQLLQTALREALASPAGTEPTEDAELELAEADAVPAPARRGRPRQSKFDPNNPTPGLFDDF